MPGSLRPLPEHTMHTRVLLSEQCPRNLLAAGDPFLDQAAHFTQEKYGIPFLAAS